MTHERFWTRRFLAASVAVGVVSFFLIFHVTGYPYDVSGAWIVDVHLRSQDMPGTILLVALLFAAWLVPQRTRELALGAVEAMARHPWRVALAAFLALCFGALFVEHNHALAQDEYAALFQSRVFAAGRLTGQFPPDLLGRLVPPIYLNQFLYGSFKTGEVASAYWPGFALLLTPFTFLGVPWACNPLIASLALVLMARIAGKLSGDPQAGGWAMLLALASPAFSAMAITYFSMNAHLFFNLLFVWLLLERTVPRLVLAGVVGSFALVLHNPVPHALFALPWLAWLSLQPQRYRYLGAIGAGYAPLSIALGLGWGLVLNDLQGDVPYGLFPAGGDALQRTVNFFWAWHIRMSSVVAVPLEGALTMRLGEAIRLWQWAVPGLPLLAAAGWWLGRRDPRIVLLGLSLLCTVGGYLFVVFSQGHGWGARYVHPAWATLPLLGAVCLSHARVFESGRHLQRYIACVAFLSLVFASSLRAFQMHLYIEEHLSNSPEPLRKGRQVVFVRSYAESYSADLIQNDPFLRGKIWYMLSAGFAEDAQLMKSRFRGARLVRQDERGAVWLLDR